MFFVAAARASEIPARIVCRKSVQAMMSYAAPDAHYRVARAGLKEGVDVFEGVEPRVGAKARMTEDLTGRKFEVTVLTAAKTPKGTWILGLLAQSAANARLYTLDAGAFRLYVEEPSGIAGGAYRALHTAYECDR